MGSRRDLGQGKEKGEVWYRVKWLDWPEEYDQWIPEEDLKNAPELKEQFEKRREGQKTVGRRGRKRKAK